MAGVERVLAGVRVRADRTAGYRPRHAALSPRGTARSRQFDNALSKCRPRCAAAERTKREGEAWMN